MTGKQGVIIPRSNMDNLMLKDEVINAIQAEKFKIWAVDTVEDGLKILTGKEAGERQRNGKFPPNTIYYLVENQLKTYAKRASEFRKAISGKKKSETDESSSLGENTEM